MVAVSKMLLKAKAPKVNNSAKKLETGKTKKWYKNT